MICSTCDRKIHLWWGRTTLPIFGTVCGSCSERLHSRTLLDGCVDGPPLAELASRTIEEFEGRRAKLIQQGREICNWRSKWRQGVGQGRRRGEGIVKRADCG